MNKTQILKLLNHYEKLSTCPKRQVAAVLLPEGLINSNWITDRLDLIAWGTNMRLLLNSDVRCERCLEGYKILCPAIHAEAQCLTGLPFETTCNNTLFVSWSPCPECCKLIIAAQITRIVVKEPRLKKPEDTECRFYDVATYDELAEKLLQDREYIRLWEKDSNWEVPA